MKIKGLITFAMVAMAAIATKQAKAEPTDIASLANVVYVENAEVYSGKSVQLSVKMNNAIEVVGFQCDFYAPEQTSVALDGDGEYVIALSEARTTAKRTNFFGFSQMPDGAIRILASSMQNDTFSGNSGEVATITLNVEKQLTEGVYPLVLRNIVIADANGKAIKVESVETSLTVKNYILGDANNDGEVNIGDYTTITNYILNRNPAQFVKIAADTNEDGEINVGDLSGLVKIILMNAASAPEARRAGLKATDITADENVIYAGDAKLDPDGMVTLSVSMKNSVTSPGFQFDIAFPEGFDVAMDEDGFERIELSTARTSSKRTDTFAFNRIGDRSYRILANSTRGLAFSGNDGEVCTIKLRTTTAIESGKYDVVLSGIVISDLDGKTFKPGHEVVATITVDENVGAELIGFDAVDGAEIYGVDGVRRAGLEPGVNIVRYPNGVVRKVLVK